MLLFTKYKYTWLTAISSHCVVALPDKKSASNSWAQLGGGHGGRVLPTFSESGNIIRHVPHIFLIRFRNILVWQANRLLRLTRSEPMKICCHVIATQ